MRSKKEIKDFLKTIDNWELTPISCFKKKSMTRCTLVELLSDFMIDLKKLKSLSIDQGRCPFNPKPPNKSVAIITLNFFIKS